jgi:hypothetical protein
VIGMKPMKRLGSVNLSLSHQPSHPSHLSQDVHQGRTLYREFNHFEASRSIKVKHSRLIPPVVVDLGELVGIIYRSDKGQAGQPQAYVHFMQDPPRLVSNIEGTQLYIVGGSYQITRQGIEG